MTELICIVCPKGCHLSVNDDLSEVKGYGCPRGMEYAKKETTNPMRVVTSSVKIKGAIHKRLPVKTDGEIERRLVKDCVRLLNEVEVNHPVQCGQIILENIFNTGVNFVAARSM